MLIKIIISVCLAIVLFAFWCMCRISSEIDELENKTLGENMNSEEKNKIMIEEIEKLKKRCYEIIENVEDKIESLNQLIEEIEKSNINYDEYMSDILYEKKRLEELEEMESENK